MSSRDKGKGNTMVIPNIPKMTDDKNRIKYMTDYEKYEAELLKHHIGTADTTTTIGLKNVPADFDRTVPSSSDLTSAEREYEKYIASRNARRKKKRFPPPGDMKVTVTKPKPKQVATVPNSFTPPMSTDQQTRSSTPGVGKSPASEAHPAAEPTPSLSEAAGGSGVSLPPLASVETGSKPGSLGVVAHTPTSASRFQRPRGPPKVALLGADNKPPAASASKPIHRGTPQQEGLLKASSFVSETRASISPRPGQTKSPAALKPSRPPSALPSKSSARRSFRKPERSPPRTFAPPPVAAESIANDDDLLNAIPSKPPMTTEEAQKYLMEHCPSSPRAESVVQPANVGNSVNECADMLRVLVNPPPQYDESVKLDLRGIDVDWIAEKRRRPAQLTTLQNWQSMTSTYGVPKITSPRSVLVLLRNGVSAADLRLHPPRDDDVLLPTDPVMRAAVKRYRMEREKNRRDALSEHLLNDYVNFCAQFSQQELIFAVNKPPDVSEKEMPTSLLQRQEKQRKQFEINKMRMARASELAEAVAAKRNASEERRQKSEEELREALELKVKQAEEARAMQQRRLAEQRRKVEQVEAEAAENLRKRQELAQKRNEERQAAMELLFEERQKNRREKEEERRRRFAHAAKVLEQNAELVMLKQQEVEKKLAEIEENKRVKAEEEMRLLKEKQQRVKEARREAARRAELLEEETRRAAREKQRQVDERIQKFMESQEEAVAKRIEEERVKSMHRREAFETAVKLQEELKRKTAAKRRQHDVLYESMQEFKNLQLAMHREREREEMASKADAIRMLQRVEEFKKLHTVAQLIEKTRVAEHLANQRAKILEQSLAERDKLNAEKDMLRRRQEQEEQRRQRDHEALRQRLEEEQVRRRQEQEETRRRREQEELNYKLEHERKRRL